MGEVLLIPFLWGNFQKFSKMSQQILTKGCQPTPSPLWGPTQLKHTALSPHARQHSLPCWFQGGQFLQAATGAVCGLKAGTTTSPTCGFSKHLSGKQTILVGAVFHGGWRKHWGIGMAEEGYSEIADSHGKVLFSLANGHEKRGKKDHLLGSSFSIHIDSVTHRWLLSSSFHR